MNHRDAEILDIVVILDKKYEDNLPAAVEQLKAAGMQITNADDENSVVEGTVDAVKLHDLEKLECVDYVRKVFTYIADYPEGDPRDRDAEK